MKMISRRSFMAVAGAATAAVALTACGGSKSGSTSTAASTSTTFRWMTSHRAMRPSHSSTKKCTEGCCMKDRPTAIPVW